MGRQRCKNCGQKVEEKLTEKGLCIKCVEHEKQVCSEVKKWVDAVNTQDKIKNSAVGPDWW